MEEYRDMAFKDGETRRAYFRDYNKRWYQRHRERLLEKRRQHNEELRRWLKQYKSKLSCALCGESHPACLQFHHRDQQGKSFNIGSIIGQWRYITLKKLQEEIGKCDILCGNCHAKLHWQEKQLVDSEEDKNAL
jgi:transcription elongation factor Elf1